MPVKYRDHRGSLDESMATLQEFTWLDEMHDHILATGPIGQYTSAEIRIEPYQMEPDPRIGWDRTLKVMITGVGLVGMCDAVPPTRPRVQRVDHNAYRRLHEEARERFMSGVAFDEEFAASMFKMLHDCRGFLMSQRSDFPPDWSPEDHDIDEMRAEVDAVVGPAYPMREPTPEEQVLDEAQNLAAWQRVEDSMRQGLVESRRFDRTHQAWSIMSDDDIADRLQDDVARRPGHIQVSRPLSIFTLDWWQRDTRRVRSICRRMLRDGYLALAQDRHLIPGTYTRLDFNVDADAQIEREILDGRN